jgi:hypothetical protein
MLTNLKKILINDYKNRFPCTTNQELSCIFEVKLSLINSLFKHDFLIIPSKMNNDE